MSSPNILIAEDEGNIRKLLQYRLEEEGYETKTTKEGDEASKLLQEMKPDIAILDFMLPGKTGLDLSLEIQNNEELEHTHIIIITAIGQGTNMSESDLKEQTQADVLIEKPFEFDNLLRVIQDLMD